MDNPTNPPTSDTKTPASPTGPPPSGTDIPPIPDWAQKIKPEFDGTFYRIGCRVDQAPVRLFLAVPNICTVLLDEMGKIRGLLWKPSPDGLEHAMVRAAVADKGFPCLVLAREMRNVWFYGGADRTQVLTGTNGIVVRLADDSVHFVPERHVYGIAYHADSYP